MEVDILIIWKKKVIKQNGKSYYHGLYLLSDNSRVMGGINKVNGI